MAEYLASVRISRDGVERWSITDIALRPDEARDLRRVINQFVGPSPQTTEVDFVDAGGVTSSWRKRVRWHFSMQDRVLLCLANGLSPEDARVWVLGNDPGSRRRLTEIGKALRRSGLLVPGDWLLTPAGEARGKTLLGGKGRNQGEGEEGEAPYLVIPLVDEGGLE